MARNYRSDVRRQWNVFLKSEPAPRLVEGVEILTRLLHPKAFPDAPEPKDATRLSYIFG